jgi:hypothetical protein
MYKKKEDEGQRRKGEKLKNNEKRNKEEKVIYTKK